MTKKHFIALADEIRDHNHCAANTSTRTPFDAVQINTLAAFCERQNSRFNRERWLGYIAGTNGKNGGSIK